MIRYPFTDIEKEQGIPSDNCRKTKAHHFFQSDEKNKKLNYLFFLNN